LKGIHGPCWSGRFAPVASAVKPYTFGFCVDSKA
jgi:hypothetical protein